METQAATLPRVFSFGFWKILCKGTGQVMFQDLHSFPTRRSSDLDVPG